MSPNVETPFTIAVQSNVLLFCSVMLLVLSFFQYKAWIMIKDIKNVMVMDTIITRNGSEAQMNPVRHDALTGLNSLAQLSFEADVVIQDTFAHPID